ncbi:olfactory receptor 14J1-like [Caloenas nicobarica]|uniref:olfactory receptor 14J1-like n=1 Tax=Caloenas nicobarica TaxID=187106 RepID=UPI0032B874B7
MYLPVASERTEPMILLRTKGAHVQRQQLSNSSSITQFLLLAFADTRELQLLHFWLFLGIYLAALLAEFYFLTIMSCDRYVAICKPLHYGTLLGSRACVHMAAAAWGTGEFGIIVVSVLVVFVCVVFLVLSYVQIFRVVLRIPYEQRRHKAFSTCLPHLAMVSLFISTGALAYLKPPSISSPSLDLAVSFLYSVVPPAVNPLIYTMRNRELKDALCKQMAG